MHSVFEEGIEELSTDIASFDSAVEAFLDNPKATKVFRIYRDSRFQKSPIPLKTNVSGLISSGAEGPFYYVQLGPGDSIAGGGVYMPSGPLLRAIREEIDESHEELDEILNAPDFKRLFPQGMETDMKVKTAPRGFSSDHPAIDHLRKKSFTVIRSFSDEEVLADDFYERLLELFQVEETFHRYLRRAFGRLS